MISLIETKGIPIDTVDIGHRHQQPSEAEIDQMLASIQEHGLLTPIGVGTSGDNLRLLYGATRLSAVKRLGWSEIPAAVFEGSPQEFECAELVENLERRHLNKDQRDELTKALVDLRTKDIKDRKELDDGPAHNSSQEPRTHSKTKVEGAKRGRPVTAEGKAKKEVAAKTGQSLRKVQNVTSDKPKRKPAPKKTSADRDAARLTCKERVERLIQEIKELLSACDSRDLEMIRKDNQPYLDRWIGEHGKLCFSSATSTDGNPFEEAKIETSLGDQWHQANHEDGPCQASAQNS